MLQMRSAWGKMIESNCSALSINGDLSGRGRAPSVSLRSTAPSKREPFGAPIITAFSQSLPLRGRWLGVAETEGVVPDKSQSAIAD